jgi:hypothetical protein
MNDPNGAATQQSNENETEQQQPAAENFTAPATPENVNEPIEVDLGTGPESFAVPTIGRIVHYYPAEEDAHEGIVVGAELAAIVTGLNDDPGAPNLKVLGNAGIDLFKRNVAHGDGEAGTWCWPPRV